MHDRDLVGQFCRIPDGQRVVVESVRFAQGGGIAAVYRYIEGPSTGQRGNCPSASLERLGKVIPL
jgi:hypothetical protein